MSPVVNLMWFLSKYYSHHPSFKLYGHHLVHCALLCVFFFNISNSSSINLLHAASIGIIFLGHLPLTLSSLIHCSKSAFHLDFSPEPLSSVFNVSQIHSTWLGFHYLNTASLTLNSLPPPPPQEHLLLSQVIKHSKTVLVVVHTQYLTSSTHYLTSSLSKIAESSQCLSRLSVPFHSHSTTPKTDILAPHFWTTLVAFDLTILLPYSPLF